MGLATSRVRAALLTAGLLLVPATAAQAAFPGADGPIAFHSGRTIYTMQPGSRAVALPEDVPGYGGLSVSPDGVQIAYDASHEIFVMNVDGSGNHRVASQSQGFADNPVFSPDGKQIAFQRNYGIWVMNADGSNQHTITPDASFNSEFDDPAWSPDGNRIAYTFHQQVWTMAADGSGRTNLTQGGPMCPHTTRDMGGAEPNWSPDGKRIVFRGPVSCANSRGTDIWVINADGSGATNLIGDDGTEDGAPVFSPSGTTIAFTRWDSNANPQLMTIPAGGGAVSALPTGTPTTDLPDWGVAAVRVHVTAKAAPRSLRSGKRAVISGKVTPASTGKVVVTITRRGAKAVRKTLRLSHSKFKLRFKAAKPGSYTVVATYPTGNHRLGSSSKRVAFKVKR